jgi:hypothetical protein
MDPMKIIGKNVSDLDQKQPPAIEVQNLVKVEMNHTATSNSRNESFRNAGDNSLNLHEQFTLLRTNKKTTDSINEEDE